MWMILIFINSLVRKTNLYYECRDYLQAISINQQKFDDWEIKLELMQTWTKWRVYKNIVIFTKINDYIHIKKNMLDYLKYTKLCEHFNELLNMFLFFIAN